MPDTITVQIPPSEDETETAEEVDAESKSKTVTVEIGRKLIARNTLCGYKNKKTGKPIRSTLINQSIYLRFYS